MKLKITLFSLITIVAMLMSFMSAIAESEVTGIINTPAVNLRTEPSTNSTSLGLINRGATCSVLKEKTVSGSLWYQVEITSNTLNKVNLNGVTGWVCGRFLDVIQKDKNDQSPPLTLDDEKLNKENKETQGENIDDKADMTEDDSNLNSEDENISEPTKRCDCPYCLVTHMPTLVSK